MKYINIFIGVTSAVLGVLMLVAGNFFDTGLFALIAITSVINHKILNKE